MTFNWNYMCVLVSSFVCIYAVYFFLLLTELDICAFLHDLHFPGLIQAHLNESMMLLLVKAYYDLLIC